MKPLFNVYFQWCLKYWIYWFDLANECLNMNFSVKLCTVYWACACACAWKMFTPHSFEQPFRMLGSQNSNKREGKKLCWSSYFLVSLVAIIVYPHLFCNWSVFICRTVVENMVSTINTLNVQKHQPHESDGRKLLWQFLNVHPHMLTRAS